MLFTTDVFDGLIIKNELLWKEVLHQDAHTVTLKVGGGEWRDAFVKWTLAQGYAGLENLISIPGTVWAAPVQNIGAYGKEINEHIVEVHGIDLTDPSATLQILPADACLFGYRDSIFKHALAGHFLITHVVFTLQKYDPDTYFPNANYPDVTKRLESDGLTIGDLSPTRLAQIIAEIRASKFPNLGTYGTAWSFFKNLIVTPEQFEQFKDRYPEVTAYPVDGGFKIPTWWIIDHAIGRKGKRIGNVWCWDKQALVVTNYGWATGPEIVAFSKTLQAEVREKCGVDIEAEVNFV